MINLADSRSRQLLLIGRGSRSDRLMQMGGRTEHLMKIGGGSIAAAADSVVEATTAGTSDEFPKERIIPLLQVVMEVETGRPSNPMDIRMLESSDVMVQMLDVLHPGLAEVVSEEGEVTPYPWVEGFQEDKEATGLSQQKEKEESLAAPGPSGSQQSEQPTAISPQYRPLRAPRVPPSSIPPHHMATPSHPVATPSSELQRNSVQGRRRSSSKILKFKHMSTVDRLIGLLERARSSLDR